MTHGLERKFWKSKTYSTVLATMPTLEKSGSRTSFCQHKCRARKIECFKFVSHNIFCIFLFYIWCIIYICILVHLDRFELHCKTNDLWQYRLWSFKSGVTKSNNLLPQIVEVFQMILRYLLNCNSVEPTKFWHIFTE